MSFVANWGIVSAGMISQDFTSAVESLKSDKHNLVAVAARKLEDAATFAKRFNMPLHFDSYDALFASDKVNIVYIGSINTAHMDLSLRAINAGKHVICEKPMSMAPAEQEQVLAAAKAKGVFFMEGIWTRFFPVIQELKKELAAGVIGEVKYVSAMFSVPIKDVPRIRSVAQGGGGIYDIGLYPIQFTCLMFGHEQPEKISCSGHLMDTGVDESVNITLLFPGGRVASIQCSTNSAMHGYAYVVGTKGQIHIPEYLWSPEKYVVNNERTVHIPLPELKTNYAHGAGFQYEAEGVRQAIAEGKLEHPFVTHDMSRLIMKIIDESKTQVGYPYVAPQ